MLAELMRMKYGIAIAGTHGKTTTTSMVATVLSHGNIDPTVVIGGRLDSIGSNAKLGQGEFLVAEADESDGSFLKLSPTIAVVTNVDEDHLDFYSGIDEIRATFVDFINKVPFYGLAVLCLDDENLQGMIPDVKKRLVTYGLTSQADFMAYEIEYEGDRTSFQVHYRGEALGRLSIRMPGRHNVLNALAAVAVAMELDMPFAAIAEGFQDFGGVGRRFEIKGEAQGIMVVDDYGHHPTELKATIDAVRDGWPEKRLVMVFQPHRYSRTRDLYEDFVQVLSEVDLLIILDVYSAGEEPIVGAGSKNLCNSIRQRGAIDPIYAETMEQIPNLVASLVQADDIVLTQGAGSVSKLVALLKDSQLKPIEESKE